MPNSKTLKEYFTKHPKFSASGKFEVIDDNTVSYCGVPLDSVLWDMLKKNQLNRPVPPSTLARLESL